MLVTARSLAKGLVFIFATFVALLACELGLRLVWHNPYRYESPDHLLKLRMHHPRTDHIYRGAVLDDQGARLRLRTDERSYILPSRQYEAPDVSIAFLGGSTTECLAVREDLRFPALVSTQLAEKGLRVNTLNVARSGNNLHDSLNILLNHIVTDHPDIAVLMHASNDIGRLRQTGNYESSMGRPVSIKHLAKWSAQIVSRHSYIIGLIRQSAISRALHPKDPTTDWRQTAQPFDSTSVDMYRQRLKAFIHMCRDFDIVPVLMTQPFSRNVNSLTPAWLDDTAQGQFNAIICETGEEEGVLVADLVRHLREEIPDWNQPNEIFYDAIHVTDKGSQVYARHIAERLEPLVRELR